MDKYTDKVIYTPRDSGRNMPVMIGLSGLIHHTEKTRFDRLFEKMTNENRIVGIRFNFPGISMEQSAIRCELDFDKYLSCFSELMQGVIKSPFYNPERIGIISSSISAAVTGQYLANSEHKPKAFASISPLYGWDAFLNPEKRNAILQSGNDFNLPGYGLRRYIPASHVPALQKINCLEAIKRRSEAKKTEIMTLIGADDDVVSIRALFEYHFALQQDKKGLETFPKIGHDIPENISNPLLEKFFTEHLLSQPKAL